MSQGTPGFHLVTETELKVKLNRKRVEEKIEKETKDLDRSALNSRRHLDEEIRRTARNLSDINARTGPMTHGPQHVPVIHVSGIDIRAETPGKIGATSSDIQVGSSGDIRVHTLQNMRACTKLSRSLERREGKRSRSPSPMALSAKSIEDLQKAACVLKNTEHEKDIQKLLCTVMSRN